MAKQKGFKERVKCTFAHIGVRVPVLHSRRERYEEIGVAVG